MLIALAGQRAGEFSESEKDFSTEPGGKGNFQAVKLQRPARATVCSHSTKDVAAMSSIESEWEHNDAQCECLSGCGQIGAGCASRRTS